MTDVRTFRAANMQGALDMVQLKMGGEAVILQTRQIARRRFLPWRKRVEEVEITAGLGVNVRNRAGKASDGQRLFHVAEMFGEKEIQFTPGRPSGARQISISKEYYMKQLDDREQERAKEFWDQYL